MKNVTVQRGENMKSVKRGAYMALGWATWNVGKRVARHKVRSQLKRRALIGTGLLVVGIVGAVIASKNGA